MRKVPMKSLACRWCFRVFCRHSPPTIRYFPRSDRAPMEKCRLAVLPVSREWRKLPTGRPFRSLPTSKRFTPFGEHEVPLYRIATRSCTLRVPFGRSQPKVRSSSNPFDIRIQASSLIKCLSFYGE